ncbi:MAG: cupredoxin family copper-binding protein [Chloroflexi bacterium]|nr:cupredoxin family copper-binding protein [Chloroflexota bacterium]
MLRPNGAAPPRVLFLLFAIGGLGLLGTLGTFAWMASSWGMGGMMGSDHMGGMMGGGRDASGDPSRQGTAAETVTIQDFAFSPGNLQVPIGARVTWTNQDSAPHSATANGGAWDTGVLRQGKSATITFTTSGTFDYYCTVHPNMKARLVVQ